MKTSLAELLAHTAWFHDAARSARDNAGPHIICIDDFYENPDAVRAHALEQTYVQYSPPDAAQVGPELAAAAQFDGVTGNIVTTALLSFRGLKVRNPVPGYRYNPPWLKARFEKITGSPIEEEDWEPGGDWWNGAFNLREDGTDKLDTIHHHYHPTANGERGWNGVVYLSPDAPASARAGTTFWRDKASGRCIAGHGELFSLDRDKYECVLFVEYVYNRLIMFRENVLHKVEGGFGRGKAARLTHSFFFRVR